MTIQELQQWVRDDWEKYPKNKPTSEQQILFLLEEMGELAEAIRKDKGNKDRINKETSIGAEMADLLISMITLANTYEINITNEIGEFKSRLASRQKQGY